MIRTVSRNLWGFRRVFLIITTPLLLLPLPLIVNTKEAGCAFVLLLMAVFWVSEVIPLSITAMFPAILFPMLGIMESSKVAKEYFKDFHFLLVGVICLAAAVEKSGLHRRIALRLVSLVGTNPAWLILGFMSGCAFISMWVHNTSAVTMVTPIAEAVLQQIKGSEDTESGKENPDINLEEEAERGRNQSDVPKERNGSNQTLPDPTEGAERVPVRRTKQNRLLSKAVCVGIAFSSNIGGIATLPGTSPNMIFSEYLNQRYPACGCVSFGNWMLMCLPISAIMLLLTWLWLHWLFIGSDFRFSWKCGGKQNEEEKAAKKVIEDEYKSLGAMSFQEVFTGVVFLLMVLLWLTRSPGFIPGWISLFPNHSDYITDATVALTLGLLFFTVPVHGPAGKYEAMISWDEFQASMPWKVSLLVGGGFALAEGSKESGLSDWLAELLRPLGDLPAFATVTVACLIVTTVTEVASNAATITIFLPILSPLAEAIQVNPLYLLIPATLSSSFSFLLPVSNPPNAVVFAHGHFSVLDMVKAGLGVNVIGLLSVLLAVGTWGTLLFSLDSYPDWAPVPPTLNSTEP
ncbi:solute carrier family 13 member 1-like [Menidia menidia]